MFKPLSSNVPIKVWMKISSGLMRKAASELSQVWMVNIFECEVKWLISTEWSKRGFGCSFEQYKVSRAFTCKACVHNLEYTCQVIFEWSLSVVSYVRKLNKKFQGFLCKARVHSIETTFNRTAWLAFESVYMFKYQNDKPVDRELYSQATKLANKLLTYTYVAVSTL